MKTQMGFLGFFDILGYQSLLINNDPNEIAESVLAELTNIGSLIHSSLIKAMPGFEETTFHSIFKEHLKWLVFSDTILISLDLPEDADTQEQFNRLLTFLVSAIHLQHNLLMKGLPLRGVLTHGSYLIQNTCFAGKPIIEAYTLAESMELSACVVAPSATPIFNEIMNCEGKSELLYDYLVPLKNSASTKIQTLNYCTMEEKEDVRDIVFKSFFAFKKDIPESVQQKILNTEQHLRFLDMQNKKEKEK
jgi:hypothetical protein